MLVEVEYKNNISILKLNNPKKLNALSSEFVKEIHKNILDIEKKANVLIVTGCEKSFAAGVNVAEIDSHSYESAYLESFIDHKWECLLNVKIPVIAAVSGYALGGGFELALMCDIIIASEDAKFGFPEINLAIMPGMGGTQMLTGIVGPKIASELLLTGRNISAKEAMELGIVSRISKNDMLMKSALDIATDIAKKSIMSTRIIKEAIRLSQEVGLFQGMKSERQMFRSLFSTVFKKEGMRNFLDKKANS